MSTWLVVDAIHRYVDRRHYVMYGCLFSLCDFVPHERSQQVIILSATYGSLLYQLCDGEACSCSPSSSQHIFLLDGKKLRASPCLLFSHCCIIYHGADMGYQFLGRSCETVPLLTSNQIFRTSFFHPLSTDKRPKLINDRNRDECCTKAGCSVEYFVSGMGCIVSGFCYNRTILGSNSNIFLPIKEEVPVFN